MAGIAFGKCSGRMCPRIYNVYRMNEQFTINRELGDSEKQLGLGIVWDALVDACLSASLKLAAADRLAEAAQQLLCKHSKRSGGNDYLECADCGVSWDYRRTNARMATRDALRSALLEYSRTKV